MSKRYLALVAVLLLPFLCEAGVKGNPGLRKTKRTKQTQSKPNIIFLLTDDHRWDALGAMGNQIIKTPNLDALAAKGILFKNAFVTTSICCVSRASLLSGQYESRHKVNDFKTDFSQEALMNTYPLLLKQAGYKIACVGKYGVGVKNQPVSYYDYWTATKKEQPDYVMTTANGGTIHNTDSVSNDIGKFLDNYGSKGPFCLSVGFKAPHEQDGMPPRLIVQDRFKDLYKDVTIPEPETADPKYWNSFPDFFRTDANIARVRWTPLLSTPALYQETVKNYYRLITGVDEAVGKLISKLKQMGLDKNTIIVFMGDNGFFLGEHGLEGKWYGLEESIRVPLIVYDPRLPTGRNGKASTQMALNIDIAPTILKMAGVPVPQSMQGVDLINPPQQRTAFFYEHTYGKSPKIPESEGVVTTDFKYLLYTEHNYEELYNTKVDPHETTNLAGNAKYRAKLDDMRALYKKLKQSAL